MTDVRISGKVLAVTVIATSLTFIDATALNQALPAIGKEFLASSSEMLWIVGAYSLTLAITLLPAGVLADRIGRREIIAIGMMLFASASMMCAIATSVSWLIAARAVQGIGGGVMITASLSLLTSCSPPSQRGRSIGTWTAWCAVATIVGPLLGGSLAEAGHWRVIFWINLPLVLIALALLRGVSERRFTSSAQAVQSNPLWKMGIVRKAIALTVLIDIAFYGLLLVFPLTLINGANYRADQSAAAQLALVLALIATCPIAGRWFDRRGPRLPICSGALLSLLGILWLGIGGVGDGPNDYAKCLLMPMVLIGSGMGLAIVGLSSTVMNAATEEALGEAAAANALAARAAAAIAIGLFGAVLLHYGVDLHASVHHAADWQLPFQRSMFLAAFACGLTILGGAKLPTSGSDWRWLIYQRERFPIMAHGPLIAAFSFCAVSLSAMLRGEKPMSTASLFVAFATCLLFFLQLRIADEFKDFEEDSRYRPYRPVPRGLVTLPELGRLFWCAALIQLLLAVWLDYRLVGLLAIAWLYLSMMSREFGMREFLESRPLLYLVSHMMIMPLVDLYATGTDWLPAGEGMPKALSWFLAASFFNGMSLDLGRKIRSPVDEEVGVKTYSVLWGRSIAIGVWWTLLFVSMLCSLGVASHLSVHNELAAGYLVLLIVCAIVGYRFVKQAKPGGGKQVELFTFIWTLAMYLGLGVLPIIKGSFR